MSQDDATSTFSYDGDGDPDTFSLHELLVVVNSYFDTVCSLEKLGQGGYHKVRLIPFFFQPYLNLIHASRCIPLYDLAMENILGLPA